MKQLPLIALILTVSLAASGEDSLLSTKLDLRVPYTFGEHKLKASKLTGALTWDETKTRLVSATFTFAVADLESDDKTLKCHLLESMTLDYAKSDFPASHVCKDDKLPTEGPNSPTFTTVTARLQAPFEAGQGPAVLLWEMHGVQKELSVPATLILTEDRKRYTLRAQTKIKRSDFGIVVKKFLFIDAADKIPLTVELEGDVL